MCYSKLPEQGLHLSTAGQFKGKQFSTFCLGFLSGAVILKYWAPNTLGILSTLCKEVDFITGSVSYVAMNNSRFPKCRVSGVICSGFRGARLLACSQLTRGHSSHKL